MLLITIFNLTAEFESLNNCYIGARERTLYFIKHNILWLNVKSNNIYSNYLVLTCPPQYQLFLVVVAASENALLNVQLQHHYTWNKDNVHVWILALNSCSRRYHLSSKQQPHHQFVVFYYYQLPWFWVRKNRAKITKRQISRATISCTNHIPAYPRPANHVAVCQSPPA